MTVRVHAADEQTRAIARAAVRANIERLAATGQQSLDAIFAELSRSRDRLVAMLATGSEFDVARARAMIVAVDEEVRNLSARLPGKFQTGFRDALCQGDADIAQMGRDLLPHADAMRLSTGVSVHLIDTAAGRSADLVGQISNAARAQLNAILRSGATGTNRPADIARSIGAVLDQEGRPTGVFGTLALQIERVHRTETASLYETAGKARAVVVARESPYEMSRVWISLRDSRTREDHAAMNGATVAVGEHFNYGAGPVWSLVSYEEAEAQGGELGLACDGPHDAILPAEAAVNCRCTAALRRGPRKGDR